MPRILCPTVVARQTELERIDHALDETAASRGGLLVVAGPAGVGKSRLLTEAAAAARGRAMVVLRGRCVPTAVAAPYRPIAEALIAEPPPALTGGAAESPVVVAESVLGSLQRAAASRGCVLCIEDIQWSDAETLHALEYLADHARSARVLVLCSLRDDAPTAARDALARLDARRAVDLIALAPLSTAAVAEMIARSLGAGALDPAVVELVAERAEGLPFLVEEVLATAVSSGALVHEHGAWHMTHAVGRVVPESFAVTVRERLHAMGPQGRRVLAAAALLGRSFDWDLAGRAAGSAAGITHEALDRAVELQLLAPLDGGYAFRHSLTRDALLAQLLPHERAELASGCLEGMAGQAGAAPEQRLVTASLAELAGRPEVAAGMLLEAGRASLSRGALESATAALERASTLAGEPPLRADIAEALTEAAAAAGDLQRTRAHAADLLDLLAEVAAPPARRAAAHLMLARCAIAAAHFDAGHEELDRARRMADAARDPALRARVTAAGAQLAVGRGETDAAEALARDAAAQAMATAQPQVACEALEVWSRCARTRDLAEAAEIGERALQVAEAAGLAYWRMRALYQIGVVEMFRASSAETLRRARTEALRLGAAATAATLDLEIAAVLDMTHEVEELRQTCDRCVELARRLELRAVEAVAHLFLSILEAIHGTRAAMEEEIRAALAVLPDDVELLGAAWGEARALAALAAEDRGRARDALRHAGEVYRRSPPSVMPRLGAALTVLVDSVDGRDPDLEAAGGITPLLSLGAGYLAFAEAVRLGRAGRHAEACAAVARGEDHLARNPWYRSLCWRLAAEAALTDGWGEPVAWLTDAASFFDEAGNARLAAGCRSLLRRAGARVARPTRGARALPAPLREAGVTPREADVLGLLSEGLSNREIGARLFVSERTVEQHVGCLKQKLGLRTRAHLAVYAAAAAEPAPTV
ncbi:MAG: AAA family ATPase [Candidatus Dormibacteraeota bacterium]|nr:AAA family ATPase [Candidatus Dormibacteraeota bacterium]